MHREVPRSETVSPQPTEEERVHRTRLWEEYRAVCPDSNPEIVRGGLRLGTLAEVIGQEQADAFFATLPPEDEQPPAYIGQNLCGMYATMPLRA